MVYPIQLMLLVTAQREWQKLQWAVCAIWNFELKGYNRQTANDVITNCKTSLTKNKKLLQCSAYNIYGIGVPCSCNSGARGFYHSLTSTWTWRFFDNISHFKFSCINTLSANCSIYDDFLFPTVLWMLIYNSNASRTHSLTMCHVKYCSTLRICNNYY